MRICLSFSLIAIVAMFVLSSCSTEEPMQESARFFYFDALRLQGGGQVYTYEPVNNPLYPLEYWHKRFSADHSDAHLYSAMLGPDQEILQKTTESISMKGAALTQMELNYDIPDTTETGESDSVFTLRVQIDEPTTFLFGPPDTTVQAIYQVEYVEPGPDSIRVILTRKRRFTGKDTYVFQDKQYPALKYTVLETLETETEGFTTSEWTTHEIYAKGIGLVYFRKEVNADFVIEYRLKDAVDYEVFFSAEEH